jgi:hypothetical protein
LPRAADAFAAAALACALDLCPAAHAEPSPAIAGLTSALIPGLGQALQKDYDTAALHFGVFAASLGTAYHFAGLSAIKHGGTAPLVSLKIPFN